MFKGFGSLGVQRHVGASERYYNGHLLSDGTHSQIPLVPDGLSEKIAQTQVYMFGIFHFCSTYFHSGKKLTQF